MHGTRRAWEADPLNVMQHHETLTYRPEIDGLRAIAVSKGAARIFTRALVADICDRFPGIVITDWIPGALATDMGIADGLDPRIAAAWGVELSLWHDRSLTGTLWAGDTEHLPPRSFKRRMLDAALRRAPVPRRLVPGASVAPRP